MNERDNRPSELAHLRSVLSDATTHYLLEYFLSTSSGDSVVSAGRTARETSGATPNREVLEQAAAYFRAQRYAAEQRGSKPPTGVN